MVQTVQRLANTYKTAILTNNLIDVSEEDINPGPSREHLGSVSTVVDAIIESSKIGVRKPDKAFYRIACEELDVTPDECVSVSYTHLTLPPIYSV